MQSLKYHPSHRMQSVQAPIIPIVGDLIRKTPGTISLGQGVVYYGPPAAVMEKLQTFGQSIENHKYGPVEGIPELLSAFKTKLKTENNIDTGNGSRIIVTAGANMAFLNALLATTDPGDEIILQVPCYFNHEMAVCMVNCKAVLVSTDHNYQLCPDRIKACINERTRAIVTVSPNNPSGAVYPHSVLREINDICKQHGIYHISDEAYEYFTYNDASHFSSGSIAGANEHTISLFSLSKAYGFASWRIGYMVVPEHLAMSIMKAQDANLICPALASQHAALGALDAGKDYCREKLSVIKAVRNRMLEELQSISSFCTTPVTDGAFYFLIKIDTDISSMELTKRLICEHRVAVIPGDTFGLQQACYLRVAYGALEQKPALEGIQRLTHGISAIVN
ncbi:MAG: pyridoxal phosphate-dependent aminotransferase [Gammaproteobacteria bacterium]